MNKELKIKLLSEFNSDDSLENHEAVTVDGIKYYCYLVDELNTEDNGKYQNGGAVFAVGIYDEKSGYKEIEKPLFYIEQDFTRSGSYYSDWYYEYDEPYIVEKKERVVIDWAYVNIK